MLYVTRAAKKILRAPEFKVVDLVTLMLVIITDVTTERPLFDIRGNSVRYRVVKMGNTEVV